MKNYRQTLTATDIRDLVGTSPLMLEIGCHEGSDTVKFLEMMPGIQLTCFDCEKRALKRFKVNVAAFLRMSFDGYMEWENDDGTLGSLCLIEAAVANSDDTLDFYASTGKAGHRDDWDFSGSLCEPTGHLTRSPEIKFKPPKAVMCCRLDTVWNNSDCWRGNVDFIWADVQGSQRMVIEGGRVVLSHTRYLYIESHNPVAYAGEPTQDELIELLAEWFEPVAVYARENILFKKRGGKS